MGTHSTRARCQMARPAPPMLMSHSGMNGLGQNGPGPFSQIGVRSDSQAATRHAKSAKTTTDLGPADWLQNYHLPVARREWAVGDCRLWQISRTDCQSGPRCSATSGRGAAHVKLHPIFQLQGVARLLCQHDDQPQGQVGCVTDWPFRLRLGPFPSLRQGRRRVGTG